MPAESGVDEESGEPAAGGEHLERLACRRGALVQASLIGRLCVSWSYSTSSSLRFTRVCPVFASLQQWGGGRLGPRAITPRSALCTLAKGRVASPVVAIVCNSWLSPRPWLQ